MSEQLLKHLRQYRHNTGVGFVFGYDKEGIDAEFARLKGELAEFEEENSKLKEWIQHPTWDIPAPVMVALKEQREKAELWDKLQPALEQHSIDMHNVSSRPCETCRKITEIIGKPYGCYAYHKRREAALKAAGKESKT